VSAIVHRNDALPPQIIVTDILFGTVVSGSKTNAEAVGIEKLCNAPKSTWDGPNTGLHLREIVSISLAVLRIGIHRVPRRIVNQQESILRIVVVAAFISRLTKPGEKLPGRQIVHVVIVESVDGGSDAIREVRADPGGRCCRRIYHAKTRRSPTT
jgi:hypothetical protein